MSLQELCLIKLLENHVRVNCNNPVYTSMIYQYIGISPKRAAKRSVTNGHFFLTEYFLRQITDRDNIRVFLFQSISEQVSVNHLPGIKFLLRSSVKYGLLNYVCDVGLGESIFRNRYHFIPYFLTNNFNMGLKCAAHVGNRELVQFFLDKGADNINQGLCASASNNQLELIKFFISIGADDMNLAMTAAVDTGNLELIKFFIEHGANDMNSGLISGVCCNNMELINFFIEHGADDMNSAMCVLIDSDNEDLEMINFFIERGANDMNRALIEAIDYNNINLIEFFIERSADNLNYGVIKFAHDDNLDMVMFFVSKGADNFQEGLEIGIENSFVEIVKFFLPYHDIDYNSSFEYALNVGNDDVIDAFLDHGIHTYDFGPNNYFTKAGPVMMKLIEYLLEEIGIYSDRFLYLKRGYGMSDIFGFVICTCIATNDYDEIYNKFLHTDLVTILSQSPCLYSLNNTFNTTETTTLDIMSIDSNIQEFMNSLNIREVTTLNIYQESDLSHNDKITLNDPLIINGMKREIILLSGLFHSFS